MQERRTSGWVERGARAVILLSLVACGCEPDFLDSEAPPPFGEDLCLDYGDYLRTVGGLEEPSRLHAVAADSARAVILGAEGLLVADLSDPVHPAITGSLPFRYGAEALAVSGPRAYAIIRSDVLAVVDLSDPAAPALAGEVEIPGNPTALALTGDLALVAAEELGLWVVDVSDPGRPRVIGSVDTPYRALGVAVAGTTAYVADETALWLIDVSDPLSPQRVRALDLRASLVEVREGRLYVGGRFGWGFRSSIAAYDISDPRTPVFAGRVEIPDEAYDVDVRGALAAVACGSGGLQLLDVSNPARPRRLGKITPGEVAGVALGSGPARDLAYAACARNGLRVVDLSNTNAVPIVATAPASPVRDLVLRGDLALAAGERGLEVIDISNPLAPSTLGWESVGFSGSVAVDSVHAYVTSYSGSLSIIDLTYPSAPDRVAFLELPGGAAADLAMWNGHAYVADWEAGLQVIDVSSPASPRVVASLALPGYVAAVAVTGGFACVTGFGALSVVDISNPVAPTLAGRLELGLDVAHLVIAGRHAFLAAQSSGLAVIDLGDPASPSLLATARTMSPAQDVAVYAGQAYVAVRGGIEVFDVSDPAAPVSLGTADTPEPAGAIAVDDLVVYVGGNAGIHLLPHACPRERRP